MANTEKQIICDEWVQVTTGNNNAMIQAPRGNLQYTCAAAKPDRDAPYYTLGNEGMEVGKPLVVWVRSLGLPSEMSVTVYD